MYDFTYDTCPELDVESYAFRYAHYLFENGNYEEAMEHFLESQVEINYVLSLYPSIILPKSSVVPEPEQYIDVGGDAPVLSRGSSGLSDDMESSLPLHSLDSEERTDLESRKMSHNTLMALIKFLQRKRFGIVDKAAAEGTEEAVSDAVGHNFVSYGNSRPRKTSKVRILLIVMYVFRCWSYIINAVCWKDIIITVHSASLQ